MRVTGFDLSLTATGVADEDGQWTITTDESRPISDRLDEIMTDLRAALTLCDLAVVEDLPRNARFGGVSMGMVHACFHLAWYGTRGAYSNTQIIRPTPATLKLYATGKGNAGKDQMLTEAVRRLGYEGHDHNEADAMWLRALGLDVIGQPLCSLPATHRKALDKLTIPAGLVAQ